MREIGTNTAPPDSIRLRDAASSTISSVANVADAMTKGKFVDRDPPIGASDGYVFTSPVGSFKPNAFGLYGMHGNACNTILTYTCLSASLLSSVGC